MTSEFMGYQQELELWQVAALNECTEEDRIVTVVKPQERRLRGIEVVKPQERRLRGKEASRGKQIQIVSRSVNMGVGGCYSSVSAKVL